MEYIEIKRGQDSRGTVYHVNNKDRAATQAKYLQSRAIMSEDCLLEPENKI